MIIYDSYDNVLLETIVSDKSSLYCGLDNKDRLTLHFTLDRHVEIPIGSWCNFEGNRYEVMSDADVKMNHTENYDYTVVLSSYFDLTVRYKVRNMVDRRLMFDLVAKPHEHLQMIVDNLNARDGGWSIGSCIDSVEKLVSYNHTNCEEALVNIANTFNTEIEVVGKVISLKKVEYFKDDPLALSYGKGNGFRPGIQRTSIDDGLPVERLFVQGGNRNISLKEYGSSELHLPKSLSFKFDGNKFDGEDGFNEDHAKAFVTDSDGMSVVVEGMAGGREDSLDLSEVYPSRVGNVTGVVFIFKGAEYTTPETSWTAEDWNEVQIDIIDETIPDSLDFSQCLMENNEPLTVIFQSGMLAGREFNATYVSSKKRFELEKQEFDGQYMPQESFIPKVEDSYAVFNVYLPASYISDATTYSGAEYDMLREASRYLYEKCVSEFTFAGEIDGMWAKKNWDSIRQRIRIGSYVSFTHEKMFPDEPALVRIVGITQYVNNPHYPKIELSNSVGVSTVSSRLNQIENKDAHVSELYEEARRYTKRRYADIKQTIEMLSDAFDNYSEGINPITVETMLAVVGDKSLQYLFTQSLDTDAPSVLEYSFDPNDGVFSVSESFIKHMTLEIDSISPVHSNDEYLRWDVAAYASESLEKDSGYYLYAKVSRDSQQGAFLLSKESIKLEAEAGYYNLLVGILNAEVDGERSFAPMYGFTEILPGQITTDTIKSADGNTWLDLLKGILHLNNMAGVSGVKTEEKGDQSIAAWFGGLMKDIELDEDKENAAKSVIRHDGTGYFADGLFKWDKDTGVNLGNDAIRINYDGSVDFGGNIRIGSTGEETLDSLLTIIAKMSEMWSLDTDGNIVTEKQVVIKNNLIVNGDTASGGEGESTPAIGTVIGVSVDGVKYTDVTAGILDLTAAFKNVSVDLSDYYTKNEVNALIDKITAGEIDLANYYTKEQIDEKGFLTSSALDGYAKESWVSQQIANIDFSNYYTIAEVDKKISGLNISQYATTEALTSGLSAKQDTISDLATIRSNASNGATAYGWGNHASAGYAKATDVPTLTAFDALRSEFDALESALNDDVSGKINTWNEIVDFLDEYSGSQDLATILAGINADIAKRVLQTDFDALSATVGNIENTVSGHASSIGSNASAISVLQGYFSGGIAKNATADAKGNVIDTYYTPLATYNAFVTATNNTLSGKADKATTLAGYGITNAYTKTEIDSKVTTINTSITAVSNRVTTLESWKTDIAKYITIVDGNVKISTNLIVSGDTASGGDGEDTAAIGTVTGIKVNGTTYNPTAGIVTIPDYPTSLEWNAISGKPTFATVATSGSYDDLSNKPTIPSLAGYATETWVSGRYLPLSGGTLTGGLTLGIYDLKFKGSDTGDIAWFDEDNNEVVRLYNNGGVLSVRHNAGTTYAVIHGGNIGSQSVKYATSAGSAPASDVYAWAKASTKPAYTTKEVTESGNLYFTNARAVAALTDTLASYATQSWVEGKKYLTSHQAVVNTGNTLSFGSAIIIGSVGEKDLTVALPSVASVKSTLGLGSLAYKSSLVASDIPSLDWSKITSGKPTTLAGYGITDGITTSGGSIYGDLYFDYSLSKYSRIYFIDRRIYSAGYADEFIVFRDGSGVDKGAIGLHGNANGVSYYYFGHNAYNGDNLRVYADSLTFGGNEILHAGNYTSYTYSQSTIDSKLASYQPLSTAINTGNIGSQSVNYATSAGSADTLDGYHATDFGKTTTIYLSAGQVLRVDMYSQRGLLINIQGTNGGRNALYFATGYQVGTTARNGIRVIKSGPYDVYFNGSSESRGAVYIVGNYWTSGVDVVHITPFDNGNVTTEVVSAVPSDATLVSSSNGNVLATLDSNVASATKLATARTIWGQSFDGTGNVTGALSGVTNINGAITVNSSGNVGIGTTSPAYKLDVAGNTNIVGTVTLPVNHQIQWGTTGHMIYGTASLIQVDAPLRVRDATTIGGALTVGGGATITGNSTINGNLVVTGDVASA